MEMKGKSIFVTGGASGLGEATVRFFAAKDNYLTIADMDEGRSNKIVEELGKNVVFVKADVTSEADMQNAYQRAKDEFGRVDAAVACAGVGSGNKIYGKRGAHPLDAFNKVMQINAIGTFNVIRLGAAQMADNEPGEDGERGVIVVTSSIAAWEGQIGQIAYAASKGAINSMVLPAARELSEYGIRIAGIAPGTMATPALLALPENVLENLAGKTPFPRRLGSPGEFASLVNTIFENAMLNGTVIRQDGAMRMQAR
jgi:NAD(P)-dependent dehydrogenase (short-subunit alcohol dehydrogenase family)